MSTPLASTDPSDIANAARCFASCIPPGEQIILRSYLLGQVGNITGPPCITPGAPIRVVVSRGSAQNPNPGSTAIKIAWSQKNSGSFITGYEVFWGTTSGGPYTSNSGVLPATPSSYTLTGLSANTTYFIVVQAIAFAGCVSANSPELSATTTPAGGAPCAAGTTYVTGTYLPALALQAGSTPSVAIQTLLAQFYCGLQTAGILNSIIYANLTVPNDVNTVTDANNGDMALYSFPFLQTLGSYTAPPSVNMVPEANGDSTINGIIRHAADGNNKSVTFINLQGLNATSSGWFVYDFNTTGTGFVMGGYDNTTGILGAVKHSDGKYYSYNGAIATNVISAANTTGAGFYSGQRVSSTDHRLYFGNSSNAVSQIGATDAVAFNGPHPSEYVWFFGVNDNSGIGNGAPQFPTTDRLSAHGLTTGMSLAQVTSLFSILDTFMRGRGGGFV